MTGPGTAPGRGPNAEAGSISGCVHLAYLKLLDAAQALPTVLDQARAEGLGLTAALERLLGIEAAAVEARRQAGRLRFASLPEPWTLDQFDFAAQPGVDQALVGDLATLRFLDDATNVLLISRPGSARRCWRSAWPGRGRRRAPVYFLRRRPGRPLPPGRAGGPLDTYVRFFAGPRLLVIDELGYLNVPEEPSPRCSR